MKYLYLVPLILALPSDSLRIILPLYLYPSDACSAWSSVTSTIESYPSVEWQVIVNPNSGPGTTSYPTDPNMIACIAKMNSYPNVMTVGYVDTAHGDKALAAVTAEVDVYAKWASYNSSANISIGGIYFDDVSSDETTTMYSYYQSAAEHARSSMPSQATQVVFNPGTVAPTQLFSYCDTMIEFEASFSDYEGENPIQEIPGEYRGKSALQVYSTPESTDVTSIVQTMAAEGVEAVYMGVDCCYKVYSATLLNSLAETISGEICSD